MTTIKSNVTKKDVYETSFKLIITENDSFVEIDDDRQSKAKGLLYVMHINVIRPAFHEIWWISNVSYRSLSARRHSKFDDERLSDQRGFLHPKRVESERLFFRWRRRQIQRERKRNTQSSLTIISLPGIHQKKMKKKKRYPISWRTVKVYAPIQRNDDVQMFRLSAIPYDRIQRNSWGR